MHGSSREHEPRAHGGLVAAFLAVLLTAGAAFFASSVGAFDRAPPARMVLIMPTDNGHHQNSP
jgi:hypothetical protein